MSAMTLPIDEHELHLYVDEHLGEERGDVERSPRSLRLDVGELEVTTHVGKRLGHRQLATEQVAATDNVASPAVEMTFAIIWAR